MSAGYSGTPLARKLGIKAGHRVATVDAPAGFRDLLEDLPAGVRFVDADAGEPLDVALLFVRDLDRLVDGFPPVARRMTAAGGLWVAWPKKSSPLAGELDGNVVRHAGLAAGLVDNKVCAIDEDWSGLRFVYRREDRAGRPE